MRLEVERYSSRRNPYKFRSFLFPEERSLRKERENTLSAQPSSCVVVLCHTIGASMKRTRNDVESVAWTSPTEAAEPEDSLQSQLSSPELNAVRNSPQDEWGSGKLAQATLLILQASRKFVQTKLKPHERPEAQSRVKKLESRVCAACRNCDRPEMLRLAREVSALGRALLSRVNAQRGSPEREVR